MTCLPIASRMNDPSMDSDAPVLAEYAAKQQALVNGMGVLAELTSQASVDLDGLKNARWRLSQASLARRSLWRKVYANLMAEVGPAERSVLASLELADRALLAKSAAHVAQWSIARIELDWRGYCDASRAMRSAMKSTILDEQRRLFPILEKVA